MDFKSFKTFFRRFNKARLLNLCTEYGIGDGLKKSVRTKENLCRILCDEAKKGRFAIEEFERFDLQYYQSSTDKKWVVYKMDDKESNKQFGLNDPECFQELFENELKSFLNCKVGILPHGNALWLRISIHLGHIKLILSPASTVYMVYVPGSSFILLSTIKVAYKNYILKAIENLFGCDSVDEIDLTGKKVGSLCNLVLNKESQGSFSHFRLNQVDENPLSRKRKREILDDSKVDNNSKLFDEQWSKHKTNTMLTTSAFGSNPQPVLERLEFKLESRFRGTDYVPSMGNTTIHCSVRFKGSDVLEGIKCLGEHGLASQPLPSHLNKIHSLSRNHFILTDKKRTKAL